MRIADLLKSGHPVIWDCEVCRRTGPADLTAIAEAKGPLYSLANRRPRCRQPGCAGRVRFRIRRGLWHSDLDTIPSASDAWWAYQETERERLKAAGYRLVDGHWLRPGLLTP